MDLISYMQQTGKAAREAAARLAAADSGTKNAALLATAAALAADRAMLLDANADDMARGRERGLDAALLDRLELTAPRIDTMLAGLEQVAGLPDPIGQIDDLRYMPSGIRVGRMRVPLGVIGIIYESRPNVTIDAASLCLKSGNATILRGGSEALASNQAIGRCIAKGLAEARLPEAAIQVLDTPDRAAVGELVRMPEYVDVIVPRGGKGLIERISQEATVPVIKHLDGNCHVYVAAEADLEMATSIAINAKTHRYGTCNTAESLLVDAAVAAEFLPGLAKTLQDLGVELRGCEKTLALVPGATAAEESDWYEEYLGPVLAVRVVSGLDEAIRHINRYGSQHTDAIVTRDHSAAMRFLREVDSSSVIVNASTRFADGFEYGLGAEIGISTDKLHARGPVGLEGLTSQKYVVLGEGPNPAVSSGPIGIFGGTFNPIHNGHLRSALELKQSLALEQVRLIPAAQPPLRRSPELSADQRAEMVQEAVASEPGLVCDCRELSRQGPSYTVDTLEELRVELGPAQSLCLIVGTDILERLDEWHRWEDLLGFAHLVVMARPGWRAPESGPIAAWLEQNRGTVTDLQAQPAGRVVMQQLRQLPISATEIRDMIASGQSPRYLLPDAVWDTIQRLGAYGAGAD